MWCGGMLETGIGRAHNIHLATMPGFVYPGDTASASRTYARDIVEQPLEATNGMMPVPAGPGIGVTLDRAFLDEVTEHGRGPPALTWTARSSSASCATAAELAVLPEFEQRIWGGESEMVSVNMLVATISEGGMAIGAFDGERIVGAVYGFADQRPARAPLALHGRRPATTGARGLRCELKQRQRAWCLAARHHARCAGRTTRCSSATRTSTCDVLGAVGDRLPRRPLRSPRRDQRFAAVRPGDGVAGTSNRRARGPRPPWPSTFRR